MPSFEHPELPLQEPLPLEHQYRHCIRTLNELNILELSLRHNTLVLPGIDPDHPNQLREYPIPHPKELQYAIEHTPYLKEKQEQGFTELSIVPAALPLPQLFNRLQQLLLTHHKQGKLFSSDGTPLNLDTNQPLYHWEGITDDQLVYNPQEFTQNHHGLTKPQFLKTLTFPGFDVLLTEPGDIPSEGQGRTLHSRKQLSANNTPEQYLKTILTQPQYAHEVGLTPEAWITRFLHTLHTNNQVIDDYSGAGKLCYLIGAFHPKSGCIPYGGWSRAGAQAYLGRFGPWVRGGDDGVRPAVRLKKIGV